MWSTCSQQRSAVRVAATSQPKPTVAALTVDDEEEDQREEAKDGVEHAEVVGDVVRRVAVVDARHALRTAALKQTPVRFGSQMSFC